MSVLQVRSAASTAALAAPRVWRDRHCRRSPNACSHRYARPADESAHRGGSQPRERLQISAGVKEIVSCAASWSHPPQAPTYPPTADVQTLAALPTSPCVSRTGFRIHVKAASSGSADRHGQAWHAQLLPRMDERR